VGSTLYVACDGSDHALWYGSAPLSPGALPSIASFTSLGGQLSAGPAIAAAGGALSFFITGTDHRLRTRTRASPYIEYSLTCYGHPAAATTSNASTTYVACDAANRSLEVITDSGTDWSGITGYGGTITDGPAVAPTSWGPVFYAQAPEGGLWTTTAANRWSYAALNGVSHGAGGAGGG
jgi:hypothetical protein